MIQASLFSTGALCGQTRFNHEVVDDTTPKWDAMDGVRIRQKRVMINRNNAVFNTLPIGLPRNQMTSLEHGVIG